MSEEDVRGRCQGKMMDSRNHGMVLLVLALLLSTYTLIAKAAPNLQAAVLPTSRSVEVGSTATFFAAIINDGDQTATNCRIELPGFSASEFTYQQTSPASNALVGLPNEPADIFTGSAQTFVLFVSSQQPIAAAEQAPVFVCDNAAPAASLSQISTFDFASSSTPIPDVIAFIATQSADGRLEMLTNSATEAFVVAVANLGVSANLEFSVSLSNANLPLDLSWCVTDALTSLCQSPPVTAAVSLNLASDATATFAVFVSGNGLVPFQPTTNRIVVNLTESGIVRSRVSVAPFTNQLPQRVDAGFGVRGGVTGLNIDPALDEQSFEVVQQGDGKLVVAGRTGTVSQSSAPRTGFLARFNTDGSRDQSFTFDGAQSGTFPGKVTLAPDGKFLLSDGSLRRFNTDGTLDLSFGSSGTAILSIPDEQMPAEILSTTVLSNGDIIAVGQAFPLIPRIWRFSADGILDNNFVGQLPQDALGPGSTGSPIVVFSRVAGLPDGNILVAGTGVSDPENFAAVPTFTRAPLMVAKFLTDGTLDPQYGEGGLFLLGQVGTLDDRFVSFPAEDLVVLADGSAVILANGAGVFGNFADAFRGGSLVKLTGEGSLDPDFGVGGVVLAPTAGAPCSFMATSLYGLADGQFVVAGNARIGLLSASASGLQRYSEGGELDRSFGDNGCLKYSHSPGDGRRERTADVVQTNSGALVVLSNLSGAADILEQSRLVKLIEAP